jgi:hypothetical protein
VREAMRFIIFSFFRCIERFFYLQPLTSALLYVPANQAKMLDHSTTHFSTTGS